MKSKFQILSAFSVLFFLLSVVSVIAQDVKGSHNVVIKERSILSFQKIEISGGYDIVLKQTDTEFLKIEADDNFHQYINTEVRNGVLHIFNSKGVSFRHIKKMRVFIGFKNLEAINVTGAAEIKCLSKINTDFLKIEVSGAADGEIDINANRLAIHFSGASSFKLKGKAKEVKAKISGVGSLSALGLETQNFNISLSGTGSAKINVSDRLVVNISGVGSVDYMGNPKDVEKNVSFLGSLNQID